MLGGSDLKLQTFGWKRRAKFAIFAMLPVLLLLTISEIVLRVFGLDRPLLYGESFDHDDGEPLDRVDQELFWSMIPNNDITLQGVRVVTNDLGLRNPKVGPKKRREFRILSLGESTTFGAMVGNDETYSALLQSRLQYAVPSRHINVINAGVSAYTSFQSLNYLKLRGLQLKPDIVLIYHEYNDMLPTSMRGGGGEGETELGMSDKQCYFSRIHWRHRKLMAYSAIYRFLHYQMVAARVERFSTDAVPQWTSSIPGVVRRIEGEPQYKTLPMRVTNDERIEILNEFLSVCRTNGIELVVIHPAYSWTQRHECALTDFCTKQNVPMFEACDSLHQMEHEAAQLFADRVHPNQAGHARLAQGLSRFLVEHRFVPR